MTSKRTLPERDTIQEQAWRAYKLLFAINIGVIIGWFWRMNTRPWVRFYGPDATLTAPPDWAFLPLLPGLVLFLWVVLPWPGKGAGGLSM